MVAQSIVPVLDVSRYSKGNDTTRKKFVKELGDAFHEVGFISVTNHGVSQELIDNFYAEARAFFALPTEIKHTCEVKGAAGQRGYTSFGTEHAKHSKVADLKEFFQIGQEVPANHPHAAAYTPNVFVKERPEFLRLGLELYRAFEQTGGILLEAIAVHLGLNHDFFKTKITHGNSILRAIYYPPITSEPGSAIRAEQHEDINLITLLVGASAGGLQLLGTDGEWHEVMPENNAIVINVGDMLQRLTNNYLKSTTHRVVNPPRSEWHLPRLSIPFFLHPVSNMDLTCLPFTVTKENPLHYEPITAGEYLDERLREIGLKK